MDIFSSVFALEAALRNVSALKKKQQKKQPMVGFFWVVLDPVHSMVVGMCAGSNLDQYCERLRFLKSSLLSTAFVIIVKMWLGAAAMKGKH